MLNENTIREYNRNRKKYGTTVDGFLFPLEARSAFLFMKSKEKTAEKWPCEFKEHSSYSSYVHEGKFSKDGFEVVVEIRPEENWNYGTAYGKSEVSELPEGAPKEAFAVSSQERDIDYFVPGGEIGDGYNWEEVFGSFRMRGLTKADARAFAAAEIQSVAQAIVSGDYQAYWVNVTASKYGIELGSDSLGGIDVNHRVSGYGIDSVLDVAADYGMVENAIEQAKEKLAEIAPANLAEDEKIRVLSSEIEETFSGMEELPDHLTSYVLAEFEKRGFALCEVSTK